MNFLSRTRIGPRLATAFGIIIAFLLAIAAVGWLSIRSIDESLELVATDSYTKVKLANEILAGVNKQARATRNALLYGTSTDREAQLAAADNARIPVAEAYAKLEARVRSAEGRAQLATVLRLREAYLRELPKFESLVRAGELDAARMQLLDHVRTPQLDYMAALEKFTRLEGDLMAGGARDAGSFATTCQWVVAIAAGAALMVAVVLARLVSNSITRPLAQAMTVAETVAAGDLRSTFLICGNDESAMLLRTLQQMNDSLAKIVGEVRQSSETIATGSTQIATGNADLSQRTEEQASNLQQTAASMEQLTATVLQNAETARLATQLAAAASSSAIDGGQVVDQVVRTMEQIKASSRQVAEIIAVIDGIAFQTNILALNAAVEAARAGEQGRGFAVVAAEVRGLAKRSADAAKEIKTLIGRSVDQVEAGSRQVSDAGESMSDIVASVGRVSDLIGEISSASEQQGRGASQVGHAVTQLDQVTQQNAALVEQSAAAAESLQHQAVRLAAMVETFKLHEAA
ncbi:methyl-accepting chemotaxis protein [Scleromatobacter humisilvae]|uniref:methyl-accepting chemotaxis protein n=1 Tax=Scleromatobacter humisilvae TaxID=2897159 RepID=UPI0023D8F9FC|nr:methyl-accepting chemotaxis protein [Scleromatobacter humisilvae]